MARFKVLLPPESRDMTMRRPVIHGQKGVRVPQQRLQSAKARERLLQQQQRTARMAVARVTSGD